MEITFFLSFKPIKAIILSHVLLTILIFDKLYYQTIKSSPLKLEHPIQKASASLFKKYKLNSSKSKIA